MNQDQIKSLLLELEPGAPAFSVLFTGKTSKKVDGLYKRDTSEILIHNRNMNTDHALVYTAIHEFAHHLIMSNSAHAGGGRVHTRAFWSMFHNLLERAEKKGLYQNPLDKDPDIVAMTQMLTERFIKPGGTMMRDFGEALATAATLCHKKGVSFDDYLDRVLNIHRNTASTIIKSYESGISPEIGYENMKTVAAIRDDETRVLAEAAFLEGKSPDSVRQEFVAPQPVSDEDRSRKVLEREKLRIQKRIDDLSKRLEEIDTLLQD